MMREELREAVASFYADLVPLNKAIPDANRPPTTRKRRKARGVGNVRLRGETWWIDYFVNGRRFRESSESPNRGDTVELLRRRLAECGKGGA